MKIQITPDQKYCSFGDGIVYEFVPDYCDPYVFVCHQCALWSPLCHSVMRSKCLSVPCQKVLREDKTDGFWAKTELIDYPQFKKMLKSCGRR